MIARHLKTLGLSTALGTLLIAGVTGASAAGRGVPHTAAPATTHQMIVGAAVRGKFGKVLVNAKGFALYYWAVETNGKVKCTGQCAKVWPPALVPMHVMVPGHIAGIMGTFTVVMRPDGAHQLAFDNHPLYTYQGDRTTAQVLCDGVDNWHVYRVH